MLIRLTVAFVLLFICVSQFSCTKPDVAFGADYLDNNYTNIVMVDTGTVALSTVFLDSFVTSSSGSAVMGKYQDPYFGTIAAETFLQVAPPTYEDIYSSTIFDSLEIILRPNKHFYGDTTQPLQVLVHQLAEPVAFAENKTALYNVNTFPVNATPIGFKTIRLRPSVTDSISIRVSDVLGADLLNKLQQKDDIVKTAAAFINYFNGLRISSGNSNAFILGFSDSVIMRLHYDQKGVVTQNKTVDFTLSNNAIQFNHITINRAGTALSKLSSVNNEMVSSSTNNAGYLQTSTGSIVKISFPYLRDFLAIKNYLKIERAELIVKPVNNTFGGYYPLPPNLRLSATTQLNQLGTDITSAGTGTATIQYGNLVIDNLLGENTGYTYDVTSYLDTLIANPAANKNGLLLSAPSPAFQSDFNRLLVGDKNNSGGSIKLKLYYINVNQN